MEAGIRQDLGSPASIVTVEVEVEVEVNLRPTISRQVCLCVGPHLGSMSKCLILSDICSLHVEERPP
jgi:hypothetical protein